MRDTAAVARPSVTTLLERYVDCVQTGGEAVLLAGERGVGKTTLLEQFRHRVSDRQPEPLVAAGACEPGTQPPYHPFRQAFDSVPSGSRPPGVTRTLAPAGPDEGDSRRRSLFADIHDHIETVATDRPVVLVVEDLHWADGATVALFDYLFEAVDTSEQPVFLVGTCRPDEIAQAGLATLVERARGDESLVELGPLDREMVASVLADRLGVETVPQSLARSVHEHTDGVALFVAQIGALLADETAPDTLAGLSPPETVEAAVTRRLRRLPDEVTELLRLGAVIGESFEVELLVAASGAERPTVERRIDTLADRRIWTRTGDRVSFAHRVLRERALALDGRPLDRLHARVAVALETTGDSPGRASRLGAHHEAAGNHTRAVEWYHEAGDHARVTYAHASALEQYRRALDLARTAGLADQLLTTLRAKIAAVHNAVGDHESAVAVSCDPQAPATDRGSREATCQLLGECSRAHIERGDTDRARATLDRERDLLAEIEAPALEAKMLGRLGELARRESEYESAREHLRAALDIARETGNRRTVGTLLRELGTVSYYLGEYERARECYVDALDHSRAREDRLAESWSLNNLGMVAWRQGSNDRARTFYEESLELKREVGDRHGEAQTLGNLGLVARREGDYDQARRYYEESLTIAREVGDRPGVATTLSNLGVVVRRQGEHDRARECYEECLAIAREVGDRQLAGIALNNLGELASRQSAYDRARERYEESLTIRREIDDRRGEATVRTNLASVARRHGRYDRAREHATKSLEIRREVGTPRDEAESFDVLGTIARARGDRDRARAYFERSHSTARDIESRPVLATALLHRAQVARERGNHESARQLLAEVCAPLGELPDEAVMQGRYSLERARLALASGDLERAREQAVTARDRFETLDSDYWTGRAQGVLGRVAAGQGRPDRARECWQAGLSKLRAVDTYPAVLAILQVWVAFERDHGNTERAEQLLTRARTVLDEAPPPTARRHREWVASSNGDRPERGD